MLDIRLDKKWLDLLAQAFTVIDASVSQAITAKRIPPACSKGCSACCYQKIPLTIIEALAIKESLRAARSEKNFAPRNQTNKNSCPFLIDGSCGIYEVRPIACRRYVVFNGKCRRDENPPETRPEDVLKPSRKALGHALSLTRPFYEAYGLWPPGENGTAPFFSTLCTEICSIDWEI